MWKGLFCLMTGTIMTGCCEQDNKLVASTKGENVSNNRVRRLLASQRGLCSSKLERPYALNNFCFVWLWNMAYFDKRTWIARVYTSRWPMMRFNSGTSRSGDGGHLMDDNPCCRCAQRHLETRAARHLARALGHRITSQWWIQHGQRRISKNVTERPGSLRNHLNLFVPRVAAEVLSLISLILGVIIYI